MNTLIDTIGYPYNSKLIIINNADLDNKTVNKNNIPKLNNVIESIELSIKNDVNYYYLISTIYDILYDNCSELSINCVGVLKNEKKIYQKQPQLLKIMLVGGCAGKTSFYLRFLEHTFSVHVIGTIGFNSDSTYLRVGNTIVQLKLFDTSGVERIREMFPYKNYETFLLFYDVSSRRSFEEVDGLMRLIKQEVAEPFVYLIGNCIDLDRQVSKEEGNEKANRYRMRYFEVSSQFNINVFEVIAEIVVDSLQKKKGVYEICIIDQKRINNIALVNKNKKNIKKNKCY